MSGDLTTSTELDARLLNLEKASTPTEKLALLTIAIPTWNRAEKLNHSLGRIAKWLARSQEIVLRVHNNASSDETGAILDKWKGVLGPRLYIVNHKRNLGLIGNYITCIEDCQTKYVWVVGDDDELADNALELVTTKLAASTAEGLVFLNFRPVDGASNSPLKETAVPSDIEVRFPRSKDMFEACWRFEFGSLCFITACVLRRDFAAAALKDWPNHGGSLALPFYVSGVCAAMGGMSIIETVCFDGVYGVGSWKKSRYRFFFIDIPIVLERFIREGYFTRGLAEPHLAKFYGMFKRPDRFAASHPRLWWQALKLHKQLLRTYAGCR